MLCPLERGRRWKNPFTWRHSISLAVLTLFNVCAQGHMIICLFEVGHAASECKHQRDWRR
eukprot:5843930-Pyramimonas_sp.AAC.1